MRAFIACAIIFIIAITLCAPPALAITYMTSPYIDSCDFISLQPSQYSALTVAEFNNWNIVGTSYESLNIDFPVTADGLDLGPTALDGSVSAPGFTAAGTATANILPFGPVNLAFPSISQTDFDTYGYQRTYFYTDVGSF